MPTESTQREERLVAAFGPTTDGRIPLHAIERTLARTGLREDDPRLAGIHAAIAARRASGAGETVDASELADVLRSGLLLVEQAVTERLIIPEFAHLRGTLEAIFDSVAANESGAVADYIPQLARVSPAHWGAAVCTIDGQRAAFGDAARPVCLQSTCKPITYALALEEHGEAVVHAHVGCEPSGRRFNELALNEHGRPHNPLINAGAIMTSALVHVDASSADRFDAVIGTWQRLTGGVRPGFSNSVYLSERETADRNFALGYFMREQRAFPPGTDLQATLEFYFQCCSLELSVDALSVVAATLANGGVCPITGERVLSTATVRKVLSMMLSCGMYDYSGAWAFRVGLPAKSGVSGLIMIVVPNVLGVCTWSPRLDALGNSVRGIAFAQELVERFAFHHFDHVAGDDGARQDPRARRVVDARRRLVDAYWAAAEGDVDGLRRLVVEGINLETPDYDGRTALHLAASEGRSDIVAYLLSCGVQPAPVDRWGNTPASDAARGGHREIVAQLQGAHEERSRHVT